MYIIKSLVISINKRDFMPILFAWVITVLYEKRKFNYLDNYKVYSDASFCKTFEM